jgi:hypothetical protein
LQGLKAGQHLMKIKAWDNANNSATVEFALEIAAGADEIITDLLNYPNPMAEATRFSFQAPLGLESFRLDIYTLSGRKIKSFGPYAVAPGYFDDIVWKGEDFVGDRVASGVYIYRALAEPCCGRETVESFGKVVVVN